MKYEEPMVEIVRIVETDDILTVSGAGYSDTTNEDSTKVPGIW